MTNREIQIIGIGNVDRADDGIGILCSRYLADDIKENVSILEHCSDGITLMDRWNPEAHVILIDCVRADDQLGKIIYFDAHEAPIPSDYFHYSTHAIGTAEAIELSRRLYRLPEKLNVYGIVGSNFTLGSPINEVVAAAIPEVCDRIRKQLHQGHGLPDRIHKHA